jgi:peptide/nickel transport system substrate-binding protein
LAVLFEMNKAKLDSDRSHPSPPGAFIAAACLGLAFLSPGPVLPAPKQASDASPKRLIIGVRGDVTSFNLYTATNAFSQDIVDLLDLKLAEEQDDFGQGPPSFRPALAASWKFSSDGLTLTMSLDPAARWSDGEPISSEDVLFTHRAATSPEVGWVGSDVKEAISAISAPDARTVRIRFKSVYPYQLMDAVEGNVLPAHLYSKTPFAQWAQTSFLEAPVGSGPFRLKRYERGALIELERNPGYLRAPLPHLDSVVFRILPDDTALVNELLTGGIDFMENVPADAVPKLRSVARLSLVKVPDLSYTFISWNTSRPLFSDARARRAMTMAIDRQAILEGLLPGSGRPSSGPILSFMWASDPSLKPLPYDPDGAKRLLHELGWEDRDGDGILDRDGIPFRFELETNQGSSLRSDVVEMVAEQLRRIGVEAVPRVFEFGAFVERHEKHDYDAFVSSWRESTKVDLKSAFHSESRAGAYNYGLYSNPELDRILDRARMESDRQAARKLWWRAQQIIVQDQPCTFLFERDRINAVPRSLKGLHPSPRSAYAGLEQWSFTAPKTRP